MKWLCLWIVSLPLMAEAAIPEELRRLQEAAEKQSEIIAQAKARKNQAQERKDQALGTLFPNLNARYNYTEIQPPGGATNAFTRINQYSTLVNLSQPIFRGSAYPAVSYTNDDIKLQQRLVEQSYLGLWQEMALAYYTGWMARVDLANISKLREYSLDQVRTLKERVRVGRSRKGELAQAEAQLMAVDSDIARAERAVAEAEQRIAFLTGIDLSPSFQVLPDPALGTNPLQGYLEQAKSRPDVVAKAQEVEMSQDLISGAKGGHMPTVDFTSNYYFMRTGVLKDSKWDVGLAVNLPLFQGGTVQGLVRERVEKKREVVLAYERLKREIDRDIRILWQNSTALDKVVTDLKGSLAKSKITYEENRRDYNYGLVTNLDVIITMNQYIATKRNYDRAVLEKELTTLQITLASGAKP